MKTLKLKIITTVSILICVSTGLAQAEADTAATADAAQPAPAEVTSNESGTTAQTQAPTASRPYPPAYPGYRPYRYNDNRGWSRPFGNDGPSFRGPWNRGSGFGFGSGPNWGSGPRYYDRPAYPPGYQPNYQSNYRPDYNPNYRPDNRPEQRPDYRPPARYDSRPYGPRPYYNRGTRFNGPGWDDGGMSFGW